MDLVLVGGGLANSLIAYRLRNERPEINFTVVERGPTLGGHHTWSFHDSDLEAEQLHWMRPFIEHSWPHHELRFPSRHRVMTGNYNTVSSARLNAVVSDAIGDRAMLDTEVAEVSATGIRLEDGTRVEATAVVDGRGDPRTPHLDVAYQKFVGLFVSLAEDHRLGGPILMDATVEQLDGYRFIYTLPFSASELLIEDTYYSDGPEFDREQLRSGILAYASHQGWKVRDVSDEESGVLPIVLAGDIDALWSDEPYGVARSGMRAALFHQTTGYSLLEAVRLADEMVRAPELEANPLYELTRNRSRALWRKQSFFRLLNRMLFRAAEPEKRVKIFDRFYGLSDGLIQRFYAGRLGWCDKLRVLTGRPPVPILRALRCLPERRIPAGSSSTNGMRGIS